MKKIAIVLALFLIVGAVGLFAQDRYTIDFSKLQGWGHDDKTATEGNNNRAAPFKRQYDGWGVMFTNLPANINWSQFNRVVVKVKAFNRSGRELRDAYGQIVCSIFYEGTPSNWDTPPSVWSAGPNVPLKADNIGAAGPTNASKDAGVAIALTKAPGGIIVQNTSDMVHTIEIVEVTFFKN